MYSFIQLSELKQRGVNEIEKKPAARGTEPEFSRLNVLTTTSPSAGLTEVQGNHGTGGTMVQVEPWYRGNRGTGET